MISHRENESSTESETERDTETEDYVNKMDFHSDPNSDTDTETETETETESEFLSKPHLQHQKAREEKLRKRAKKSMSSPKSKRRTRATITPQQSDSESDQDGTPKLKESSPYSFRERSHRPPQKKPKRAITNNEDDDSPNKRYNFRRGSTKSKRETKDSKHIDNNNNYASFSDDNNNNDNDNDDDDEVKPRKRYARRRKSYSIVPRKNSALSIASKKFRSQLTKTLNKQFPIPFDRDPQEILHRRTCVGDTGSKKFIEREYLIKWNSLSYRKCCWVPEPIMDEEYDLAPECRRFDKRFEKLLDDLKTYEFTKHVSACDKEQQVDLRDWSLEDGIDLETLEPTDILFSLDPSDEDALSMFDEKVRRKIKERYFLVKWRGLKIGEATWETAASLMNDELIKRYDEIRDAFSSESLAGIRGERQRMPSHVFASSCNLLPHQKAGADKIVDACFSSAHGVIVADGKGLGKTVQTVVALRRIRERIPLPILVVSPLSFIEHWKNVIHTWSNLVSVIYNGSSEERNLIKIFQIYSLDNVKNNTEENVVYKFDVLITTRETLNMDIDFFKDIGWGCVVIDETSRTCAFNGRIRTNIRDLSTGCKILISRSPLPTSSNDLWSMVDIMGHSSFSSAESFQAAYKEKGKAVLGEYLLDRTTSSITRPADYTDSVLEAELTPTQRAAYSRILENYLDTLFVPSKEASKKAKYIADELLSCCNHPILTTHNDRKSEDGVILPVDEIVSDSGKMALLERLLQALRKEGGHKVLIYSLSIHSLDLIEHLVAKNGYEYVRIDSTTTGNSCLEEAARYREKGSAEMPIALLSIPQDAPRIDLSGTDTIIVFDGEWCRRCVDECFQCCCEWTTSQADGSYDNGKKHSGKRTVFRLVTKGTCEAYLHNVSLRCAASDAMDSVLSLEDVRNPMTKLNLDSFLRHSAFAILNKETSAVSSGGDVLQAAVSADKELPFDSAISVGASATVFWKSVFPQEYAKRSASKTENNEIMHPRQYIGNSGDDDKVEKDIEMKDILEKVGNPNGDNNKGDDNEIKQNKLGDEERERKKPFIQNITKEDNYGKWTQEKRDILCANISTYGWNCPEIADNIAHPVEAVQDQARNLLSCLLNNVERSLAAYYAVGITGIDLASRGLNPVGEIQPWMLAPDSLYQEFVKVPLAERKMSADDSAIYDDPKFVKYLNAESSQLLKNILFMTRLRKLVANNFLGFIPCDKPFVVSGWTTEDDMQLVRICARWGSGAFANFITSPSSTFSVAFVRKKTPSLEGEKPVVVLPSKRIFLNRLNHIVKTNFASERHIGSRASVLSLAGNANPTASPFLCTLPNKNDVATDEADDTSNSDGSDSQCLDPKRKMAAFGSLRAIANLDKDFYLKSVRSLENPVQIPPRVILPNLSFSKLGDRKPNKVPTRKYEVIKEDTTAGLTSSNPLIISENSPEITPSQQEMPSLSKCLDPPQQCHAKANPQPISGKPEQNVAHPPTEQPLREDSLPIAPQLAQPSERTLLAPIQGQVPSGNNEKALNANILPQNQLCAPQVQALPPISCIKFTNSGAPLDSNERFILINTIVNRGIPYIGGSIDWLKFKRMSGLQGKTTETLKLALLSIISTENVMGNERDKTAVKNAIEAVGFFLMIDIFMKNLSQFSLVVKTSWKASKAFPAWWTYSDDLELIRCLEKYGLDNFWMGMLANKFSNFYSHFRMAAANANKKYRRTVTESEVLATINVPNSTEVIRRVYRVLEWCGINKPSNIKGTLLVQLSDMLPKEPMMAIKDKVNFIAQQYQQQQQQQQLQLHLQLQQQQQLQQQLQQQQLQQQQQTVLVTQLVSQKSIEKGALGKPIELPLKLPSQNVVLQPPPNIQNIQIPPSLPPQLTPNPSGNNSELIGINNAEFNNNNNRNNNKSKNKDFSKIRERKVIDLYNFKCTRDKRGNIIYETPIQVDSNFIITDIGTIDTSPNFHTQNYIYPVGFNASREIHNPYNMSDKIRCICTIQKEGTKPIFRVKNSHGTYEGVTPTIAWSMLLVEYGYKWDEIPQDFGERLFGFKEPLVVFLIQSLPGANKCANYKFKTIPTRGKPFLKSK